MNPRREAYPGPASFQDTPEDRALFFGRSRERRALATLVLAEPLVLLFARSGLGKTSLLNAGLKHELRQNGFFPVTVRLTFNPQGGPVRSIFDCVRDEAKRRAIAADAAADAETLWEFFQNARFSCDGQALKPVLVLDQFEELFTRILSDGAEGEARVGHFLEQLADLVQQRVPEAKRVELMRRIKDLPPSSPERCQLMDHLYQGGQVGVKVVISIREDFLPELAMLKTHLPDVFRASFRLQALSLDNAREAVLEPSHQTDVLGEDTFTFAGGVVDEIVTFLARQRTRGQWRVGSEVNPHLLQILCLNLNRLVLARRSREIRRCDLGGTRGMRRIIHRRYFAILRRFWRLRPGWGARKLKPGRDNWLLLHRPRQAVRKLCENGLVTTSGHRNTLDVAGIRTRFGVSDRDLAVLVDERLLNKEERLGTNFFELSHDTWIEICRAAQWQRRALFSAKAALVVAACVFSPAIADSVEREWQQRQQLTRQEAFQKDLAEVTRRLANEKDGKLTGVRVEQLAKKNQLGQSQIRLTGYLANIDFSNSVLLDANLAGVVSEQARLEKSQLRGVSFLNAQLPHVSFVTSDISEAKFDGVVATSGDFSNVSGVRTVFAKASLDEAKFEDAILDGADFCGASLNGAHFKNANLRHARFENASLRKTDFSGAELANATFDRAEIEGANFSNVRWWTASGWSSSALTELNAQWPSRHYAEGPAGQDEFKELDETVSAARASNDREALRDALNNRAWFCAIHGTELDRAMDDSEMSLELDPRNSHFLDTRGYIFLQLGNFARAVEDFRQSIQNDQDLASSAGAYQYHLALALERLGDTTQAAINFQRARKAGYVASYEQALAPAGIGAGPTKR